MTTVVKHIKKKTGAPNELYIGRGSKWGNPFKVGKDYTRAEVIHNYMEWLFADEQLHLRQAIDAGELDDKVLLCFCHPKPCHGDILAQLANARTQ